MPIKGEKGRILFTEEEKEFIAKKYPTCAMCDIADYLGVSPGVISKYVKEAGLHRMSDWSPSRNYGRYIKNYKHDNKHFKRL